NVENTRYGRHQEVTTKMNDLFNLSFDPTDLPVWLRAFLKVCAEDCARITLSPNHRHILQTKCLELADRAYEQNEALVALHNTLSIVYANEFTLAAPEHIASDTGPILQDIRSILESAILRKEYSQTTQQNIASYPQTGSAYVKWLKNLIA